MENYFSPCGIDCEKECGQFGKGCNGCNQIAGKIFWAEYLGVKVCPIYDCSVNKNKHKHCGECEKLPCKTYYDCKDPSTSDEQHNESVNRRTQVMRNRK